MSQIDLLRQSYFDECIRNGFHSDDEFVSAWKQDPSRWASLFALRMHIISSLSSQYGL